MSGRIKEQFIEGEKGYFRFISSFLNNLIVITRSALSTDNQEKIVHEKFIRTFKRSITLIRQMHLLNDSLRNHFMQEFFQGKDPILVCDTKEGRANPIHLRQLISLLEEYTHMNIRDKQYCLSIIDQILNYYLPWADGEGMAELKGDLSLKIHVSSRNNNEEGVL